MKEITYAILIILGLLYILRIFYYLGDIRRRIRIVETKNKDFIIQKAVLFIPFWQRACQEDDKIIAPVIIDISIYTRMPEYDTLGKAIYEVEKYFKSVEKENKSSYIVQKWYSDGKIK